MNLLNLAPDIREAILFLPLTRHGHHPIKEWMVRPIAAEAVWEKQRRAWRKLVASATPTRVPRRAGITGSS